VHSLASVSLDGKDRQQHAQHPRGDWRRESRCASQMLGRTYALASKVIRGDQLGRQIGFPTANLDTSQLVIPPNGVYAAHAHAQGRLHRAVGQHRHAPDAAKSEPKSGRGASARCFRRSLRSGNGNIAFVEKLRDEQKFSRRTRWQKQIHETTFEAARRMF